MKEQFSIKVGEKKQGFTIRSQSYFKNLSFLEEYLYGHNGFIAGGCFKDIFTGNKLKDIDLFFKNEEDYKDARRFYMHVNWEIVYENPNAISFKHPDKDVRIELIKRCFGTPEYIMSQFDFSVCKFAYMKTASSGFGFGETRVVENNYEVMFYGNYFEDLTLRKIIFDNEILTPTQSFDRVLRYTSYGFIIDKEEKLKLLNSLIKLDSVTEEDLNDDGY